ncbi:MAG: hypothetical protein LUE21_05755 [Oscillospiraceae bacterium]|nr:hypothetical protein [Oscillospiraceae bacterium]
MKRNVLRSLALLLALGCLMGVTAFASGEASGEVAADSQPPVEAAEEIDAYTSASSTRTLLADDDLQLALATLASISDDLATTADASVSGYEAPADAVIAQVMSVNDEGSVSLSTIHAWKVDSDEDGATVTVVMTDGQTIRNLIEEGDRGTILVHGDQYYILHVETESVTALEYSDDAYEAGAFNIDYSGAENQLTEYTVTFRIYALESSMVFMFD